jgi:uncharacterized protein (DUF1800 family)
MANDQYGALIALNRFGLGARPGDRAQAAADPRGFVRQELEKKNIGLIDDPALSATQDNLQMLFDDPDLPEDFRDPQTRRTAAPARKPMYVLPKELFIELNSQLEFEIYAQEAAARFRKQFTSSCGFVERLVAFWSNHFAISADKDLFLRVTAGSFEREAIRPHVLGRFADMLKAVEQHPAMIFMLDNINSIGPGSKTGKKQGKGLNENLAREILELHSLGVNNYTQADVTSLARIITGWTYSGPRGHAQEERGTFIFVDDWHEPGTQSVLGKNYSQPGKAQGEAALRDFALHPATATHIATKLIRHFIADDPPADLIEKIAQVFRDTEGDLKAVALALLKEEAAWKIPLTKIRNPQEFIMAALRSVAYIPPTPLGPLNALMSMGMLLWDPLSPKGFDDIAATWASPISMKIRLDICAEISAIMVERIPDLGDPLSVLETVAGLAASKETQEAMERAESRQQGLALLFMSPEFQRR